MANEESSMGFCWISIEIKTKTRSSIVFLMQSNCLMVKMYLGKMILQTASGWLNHLCALGDPDLIAVFESGEKKYAIFIEAKLKDYVSSCFSLEREDGIVNLKGQSSKLNVQLSFRYRFVQAFKEAQKKSSQAIIEPCHKHPDGRRRKLQKESVVESVTKFLEGVDEYYFIALTNDSSSETVIEEMSSNFHPPLNDFDKQYFGILTYKDLINEGIVGEKLGFFDKACKMMGVKILQLSMTLCKIIR